MTKVYVLLNDANNIYFPVKADTDPYSGAVPFCAGSPQFFGGTVQGHETDRQVARRETAEESQLTYLLANRPMTELYQANVGTPAAWEDGFFYSSSQWSNPAAHQWPGSLADWQAYPPGYREMCCVVSTPINGLITALGLTRGQQLTCAPWQLPQLPQLAAALVNAAVAGAPPWALPQVETVPSADFLGSETLNAFACFVCNCL